MAIVELGLLPATAGIQLQSSPYAPPAPLDLTQIGNLQQMEDNQRRMEMEARRLDMAERQMEISEMERMHNMERQSLLDRMSYIDQILNVPIPPKRAEEALRLQEELGITDILDPSRIDIPIGETAKAYVRYATDPRIRRWMNEQSQLESMGAAIAKSPNAHIFERRVAEWMSDDTGEVSFPRIDDLDYIDYEKVLNDNLNKWVKGAESTDAILTYIDNFFQIPSVRRQLEWDVGPSGAGQYIERIKDTWRGFDPTYTRAAAFSTKDGRSINLMGIPGVSGMTPQQIQEISKHVGGESPYKFTEAYVNSLVSQLRRGTPESRQEFSNAIGSILSSYGNNLGEDVLEKATITPIDANQDLGEPVKIKLNMDPSDIGNTDEGLSWIGGKIIESLNPDGSNIFDLFEDVTLIRGEDNRADQMYLVAEGVRGNLIDHLLEDLPRSGWLGRENRYASTIKNSLKDGVEFRIPLGSGNRVRELGADTPMFEPTTTTEGGVPGGAPTSQTPSTRPQIDPAYSLIIDLNETSPEVIDLGDGRTTLKAYNQPYKDGKPIDDYLEGLSEQALRGLLNNSPGTAKYVQLSAQGVPNILENMTVSEIQDLQRTQIEATRKDPDVEGNKGTGAMGRSQIVSSTLNSLLEQIEDPNSPWHIEGFDRNTQLFSQELQDLFFEMLLDRRGLGQFLEGRKDVDSFADDLSDEWTSLKPIKADSVRWQEFKNSLIDMKNQMLGVGSTGSVETGETTPEETRAPQGGPSSPTDFDYFGFKFDSPEPSTPARGRGSTIGAH